MTPLGKVSANELTPILYVRDMDEAIRFYTEKLLFQKLWTWGEPPTFGAVKLDKVEVFLCQGSQGQPGTWLYIFIDDVDGYFERIAKLGAEIVETPNDKPWDMRELVVRDPNEHVIRFGQGLPAREPKIEIERVGIPVHIEKRLAALLVELSAHKKMTVGEAIEEMLLHSFEKIHSGDVANPHTEGIHRYISELKKKHGIDYDCHANYRFVEKLPPS